MMDIRIKKLIEKKLSLSSFTIEMNKMGYKVVDPTKITTGKYIKNSKRFFPKVDNIYIVTDGYLG